MKTTRALIEQKIELQAQIDAIDAQLQDVFDKDEKINTITLQKELRELFAGVGRFRPNDGYAPDRVYSQIPGVKNIRVSKYYRTVLIKATDKRAYLLPSEIELDGETYTIEFTKSRNFTNEYPSTQLW